MSTTRDLAVDVPAHAARGVEKTIAWAKARYAWGDLKVIDCDSDSEGPVLQLYHADLREWAAGVSEEAQGHILFPCLGAGWLRDALTREYERATR